MRKPWIVLLLLAGTGPFLGGCGAREEARPTPPPAVEIAPATNAETEAPLEPVESRPPATPAPETAATDVAGPVGTVVPAPRPDPTRAVPAKAPAAEPARAATPSRVATTPPTPPPPPATPPTVAPAPTRAAPSDLVDPGGEIVVPPGKAGVTRVGVDKCKVCHKVQHASWAASGHAKRMPPLDCEGCHGPGSEYRAMAVMKDPAKARAAGLVEPDAGFCARCHSGTADRAFFAKVHAHKTAP